MDLYIVNVRGFRRFREATSLKTNGKLVALVGPNEAGKSSFLHAIALLGHDNAPEPSAVSRGLHREALLIEGHFFLSAEDVADAALDSSRWFIVRKDIEGPRSYEISPPPPKRDLSHRAKLWQTLNFTTQNKKFRSRLVDGLSELDEAWEDTSAILQSDGEDLGESDFSRVKTLITIIKGSVVENDAATIKKVPALHVEWEGREREINPTNRALEALKKRIPEIIVFSEEDRNLQSEYSIPALAEGIPVAFQNLCAIGGLDIQDLLNAYQSGDTAGLTTLEHAANKNLEQNFGENWQQSGVNVTFRIHGDTVAVQVVNERSEFTSFAERSDGLRQFVALQSFSTCKWTGAPILLIDEAEQKLHYDAQADLVQMLARQQVASKVIFTTHSAGCLPEDLGNGVRFAKPKAADETRSEIVNNFWADNEPGFAPLLFGMGASTLAFFPTRKAVMVEGPADMLLLPTMFREALSIPVLGFQFVPGLSVAEGLFHAPVIGRKSGVLFLTDGDPGGIAIKGRLVAGGMEKRNIFVLKTADGKAVETEDFVDPSLLIAGINSLLGKFHGTVTQIGKKDLSAQHRMASAENWYKNATKSALPKVQLAYEILDVLSDNPGKPVLDPKRKSAFSALTKTIMARFKELN